MNCYFHPDQVAVATCQDCGIGLCQECASKFKPALCPSCAEERERAAEKNYQKAKKKHLQSAKEVFLYPVIWGAVIAVIIFVVSLIIDFPMDMAISCAIIGFFAKFGWNATATSLDSESIISFIFHIVASVVLGVPMFLYYLFMYFKEVDWNKKH